MKQALASRRLIIGLLIVITATACMRAPVKQLSDPDPVLLLYQAAIGDETAVLHMQRAGSEVVQIADGVIPGSHREWNGSILFLNERFELLYASMDQKPYKLLESVRPYQYGFMDNGRQLYAVTVHDELFMKAFGKQERVIGERIVQVLPLEDRLLARRDDGMILSIDYVGDSKIIAEDALSLEPSGGSHYAIIRINGGLLITDGEAIIYTIHSETTGPLTVHKNGQIALYLDQYDITTGSGELKLLHAEDPIPRTLAEQVSSYSYRTSGEIWYTTQRELYAYDLEHHVKRRMAEAVEQIVYASDASTFGEAAVTLDDGRMLILDEAGEGFTLEWEERVLWVEAFASGWICALENGTLYYVSPDDEDSHEIGTYREWTAGRKHVVGIRQSEVIAIDDELNESLLLPNADAYRYVFIGEKLLNERLLQLTDITGVWRRVDEAGDTLEIYATSLRRGAIQTADGEVLPFIVRYATADSMQLTLTGTSKLPYTLEIDQEGRLILLHGESHKVFVRAQK